MDVTFSPSADREQLMRRLLPLVSAFMLVLMLWTGSAAHAAEAIECGDATEASSGHFEGDGDEVPADSDKATPHHHGICHGHCVGVAADAETMHAAEHGQAPNAALLQDFHSGTPPGAALRPPIA
jgi:hypothetical protein